jgi:hypothetical protein
VRRRTTPSPWHMCTGETERGPLATSKRSRHGCTFAETATDWYDGNVRQRRELEHSAKEEASTVPIHPEFVKLLRSHLNEFGPGPVALLFVGDGSQTASLT